jgi:preprotein translocase subunit SecY
VAFLGRWEHQDFKSEPVPVGGLSYWLTPPKFGTITSDPTHASVYTALIIYVSVFLSRHSINNPESLDNPEKLTGDLIEATGITLAGVKSDDPDKALKEEIDRLMPIAAILGGFTLGIICVLSDILGIVCGSQCLLIAAGIIHDIHTSWLKAGGKYRDSRHD